MKTCVHSIFFTMPPEALRELYEGPPGGLLQRRLPNWVGSTRVGKQVGTMQLHTSCIHTNVTSNTITCPIPNPNQKKTKCRPRIPNPNTKPANSRKGRLFAGSALGLEILHYPLNLTQCFSVCVIMCSIALYPPIYPPISNPPK